MLEWVHHLHAVHPNETQSPLGSVSGLLPLCPRPQLTWRWKAVLVIQTLA